LGDADRCRDAQRDGIGRTMGAAGRMIECMTLPEIKENGHHEKIDK
jgi:hypothetical protein